MNDSTFTRRDLLKLTAAMGLAPLVSANDDATMLARKIPASGEMLPVIGLGTYRVFDIASSADNIASRKAIVDLLVEKGGRMIDTSPMYDRSEKVIGDTIKAGVDRERLFIATKVWTDGKAAGEQQMSRSAELMNAPVMDLMQVHNLRDLDTHWRTIRSRQEEQRIRYNGVTDYRASALTELERVMKSHRPQFIQINYSLGEFEADERVLPLAKDLGIAVIVNRPFVAGRLFRAVAGMPVPDWAQHVAASWGQFFLKFITSHPAVNCVIPGTSKPHHMADNLAAGFGALPDAALRKRMLDFVSAL